MEKITYTETELQAFYTAQTINDTSAKKYSDLSADEKTKLVDDYKTSKGSETYTAWTQQLLDDAKKDNVTYYDVK